MAQQYAGEIIALRRYLARVGTRPEVIEPAIAEALAQLVNRPDITRPMAYLSTVCRGEAERLTAEADIKGEPKLSAPDLMKAIAKPQPRRRQRRTSKARKPSGQETGQQLPLGS